MWRLATRLLPFLGQVFSGAGRTAIRNPLATAVGADIVTDGASTSAILGAGRTLIEHRIGGDLSSAFNSFARDMEKNGLYAAVPLAMAFGAISGDGILGKAFSAVALAAVAYLGVRVAEANGYTAGGLSMNFGASADTRPSSPQNDRVSPVHPQVQTPALIPQP